MKLRADGRNNSQHCWLYSVRSCCVRLPVAKILAGFKLCTLRELLRSLKPVKLMSQQFPIATFHLFRDRRSVAQQCWIR